MERDRDESRRRPEGTSDERSTRRSSSAVRSREDDRYSSQSSSSRRSPLPPPSSRSSASSRSSTSSSSGRREEELDRSRRPRIDDEGSTGAHASSAESRFNTPVRGPYQPYPPPRLDTMRGEKQVDPHAQHAQPHPSHLPFARHPVYRAPFVPFGAFPGAAMPPRGRGGFFPDRGRGAGVRGRGRGAFPFGRGASMLPGMMFAHPPPMEDPTLKHGKMEGGLYYKDFEADRELKNDYNQHFVDTGLRPQNFIREPIDIIERFADYPVLRDLMVKKQELVATRATPPFYLNCDLRTFDLRSLNSAFDVVLIDPPWEEYYNRQGRIPIENSAEAPFWTFDDLASLDIGSITSAPSFVFLWVGSADGLDLGRHLLRHWGFRRSEDIVWLKTNKDNKRANMDSARDMSSTFLRSKEHCLMGIKGSVRRNTDPHLIHANVDTDIVISEENENGGLKKPEEMYHIIEHFCLGRRRLELFGEDHNIRPGWITLGNKLSSSNWNAEAYSSYFKGTNGHLLGTTPSIENLRPKSPTRDDSKLIMFNSNKKAPNKGPPDVDIGEDGQAIQLPPPMDPLLVGLLNSLS